MDGEWCVRCSRFDIRIYADISTSAELSSTGIPAVLCSDHIDDPSIRHRIMVCQIHCTALMTGWDIAFIDQRRITNSGEMRMRLLSSAVS